MVEEEDNSNEVCADVVHVLDGVHTFWFVCAWESNWGTSYEQGVILAHEYP